MGRYMLDEHTADRLLSGALAPEAAPPGLAGVATLLKAASQPPTGQEVAGCAQTVAAMAGAVATPATAPFVHAGRRAGLSRLLRPRIAATLTAGALALFSGFAAAGALPGPVQHAAHVAFGAVGISVPDSGTRPGTAPTGTSPTRVGPGTPASGGHTRGGAHAHQAGTRGHGGATRPRHHGSRGRRTGGGTGHSTVTHPQGRSPSGPHHRRHHHGGTGGATTGGQVGTSQGPGEHDGDGDGKGDHDGEGDRDGHQDDASNGDGPAAATGATPPTP